MRADLGNINLRRCLKTAAKGLEHVRIDALPTLIKGFVSQLELRIKNGDQAGFYKQPKRVNFGRNKSCSPQYFKDAEGSLPRNMGLICDWWLQWFSTLINTKGQALDPNRRKAQRVAHVQTSQ
ncbi:MAG: hypothetical protein ABJO88_00025 [Parasphingorhabdus sp.]